MKLRPVIFSDEMVRAILNGTKTQTRRVMRPQPAEYVQHTPDVHRPKHAAPYLDAYCSQLKTVQNPRGMSDRWCWWTRDDRQSDGWYACPFGKPGDHLWVREACAIKDLGGKAPRDCFNAQITYLADDKQILLTPHMDNWRLAFEDGRSLPSVHVPRWASRITLEVTNVRVERLNDISAFDAMSEGLSRNGNPFTIIEEFSALWDCSYANTATWESNPWVWVVEFKRVKGTTLNAILRDVDAAAVTRLNIEKKYGGGQ